MRFVFDCTRPGKNLFSFSSCVDGPGIWRACTYSMGTPRGSADALEAPVESVVVPTKSPLSCVMLSYAVILGHSDSGHASLKGS